MDTWPPYNVNLAPSLQTSASNKTDRLQTSASNKTDREIKRTSFAS